MTEYHDWSAVGRDPWLCAKCGATDLHRESPPLEGCEAEALAEDRAMHAWDRS